MTTSVWKSEGTCGDPEGDWEKERVEMQAVTGELEREVDRMERRVRALEEGKQKCEEEVIALENECRRLDYENHQLRTELSHLKQSMRSRSELPTHMKTSSSVQMSTPAPTQRVVEPQLEELREKLDEMVWAYKTQGGMITRVMEVLRKTRTENSYLLDKIESFSEAVRCCDCKRSSSPSFSPTLRSPHSYSKSPDCSRLLDELQDLPGALFYPDERLFQPLSANRGGMLVAAHTVENTAATRRSCGTQTGIDRRKKPEARKRHALTYSLLV